MGTTPPIKIEEATSQAEVLYCLAMRPWGLQSEPHIRFKIAREMANLPGKFLGKSASRQLVNDWERGRKVIPVKMLNSIAAKTKVSFAWLLEGYQIETRGKNGIKIEEALSAAFSPDPNAFNQPYFLKTHFEEIAKELPFSICSKMKISSYEPLPRRNSELRSWAWFLAHRHTADRNPNDEVDLNYSIIGKIPPPYCGNEIVIPLPKEIHNSLPQYRKVLDGYRKGVPRKYIIRKENSWDADVIYFNRPNGEGIEPTLMLSPTKLKAPELPDPADDPNWPPKGFSDRKPRR